MSRPSFDYRPMIDNIRKLIPNVSIRTAFVVGYPGETEEHFEHLCNFVRDMKFDMVFCSQMDKSKPWKFNFFCWGANKVRVMDEWATQNKIIPHVVRAYSDHWSDMPMMEISDEQVWIDSKTGLRK
jgi:hypothetical protein